MRIALFTKYILVTAVVTVEYNVSIKAWLEVTNSSQLGEMCHSYILSRQFLLIFDASHDSSFFYVSIKTKCCIIVRKWGSPLPLWRHGATHSSESCTLPSSVTQGRSGLCDNNECVIHFSFQFVISRLRATHSELYMWILTSESLSAQLRPFSTT